MESEKKSFNYFSNRTYDKSEEEHCKTFGGKTLRILIQELKDMGYGINCSQTSGCPVLYSKSDSCPYYGPTSIRLVLENLLKKEAEDWDKACEWAKEAKANIKGQDLPPGWDPDDEHKYLFKIPH